ncbi:hypothetical protein DSM3645_03938 [Blastopirellula marina DSM 3645]|uniref:Uncharacterized protein n=1 Tax=Blastopirellula marina DSM 3645 TaxID=314230 RepID=A3ZV59_9BACT|nr:hypothetical protein DSM3645_03938 [Blastopirellula marina DSM 3645]
MSLAASTKPPSEKRSAFCSGSQPIPNRLRSIEPKK